MFPDEAFQAPAAQPALAPELEQPAATTAAISQAAPEHRALYLRWRPKRFEDVVGQEHVTRTLRNAVVSGRLAHAYLFTGPRGTGKTSVARILYRAAVCQQSSDGDPCNTCPTCVAALTGRSLDLVEIDAASNRGIDDIRDLREKVAYRPSEGAYRLFIIDEAHELTAPAWDAFLKTLEEPPEHAIFVMATTEAHKVPATIVSRCQRFDFRRIPLEATRDQLAMIATAEGMDIAPEVLDRLARVARGGLRDAESLLDQVGAYGGQHVDMDTARAILGLPAAESVQGMVDALTVRDAATALDLLSQVSEGGGDLRQFCEELVVSLRAILLLRAGAEAALRSELTPEDLARLKQASANWSTGPLAELIRRLSDVLARTRDAQQFQVQVELALLSAVSDAATGALPSPPVAGPAVRPRSRQAAEEGVGAGPAPTLNVEPSQREAGRDKPVPYTSGQASTPTSALLPPINNALLAASSVGAGLVPARTAPPPGPSLDAEPNEPAPYVSDRDAAAPTPEPVPADEIAAIRQRWQSVVDQLNETGKALSSAQLRGARPLSVTNGVLTIAFETDFNRKRFETGANREKLEHALSQVVGHHYRVRCTVENVHGDDSQALLGDPVLATATRLFGGHPERAGDDEPAF